MVSEIRIYMEGGGNTNDGRRKLRNGMAVLLAKLKKKANDKGIGFKIIAAGSRDEARRAFRIAQTNSSNMLNILLVDAEDRVSGSPIEHLRQRDNWDLSNTEMDQVYLMAPTMEAWIVADIEALQDFYGAGLNQNPIPRRTNIEETSKSEIENALNNATKNTTKGIYKKIDHGTELLGKIKPDTLKDKAPEFKRFWETIDKKLDE